MCKKQDADFFEILMREEEKETNTTPQNQVSLSLLESVWCSFLVGLFVKLWLWWERRRSSLSLSLVSFAAEKIVPMGFFLSLSLFYV